MQQDLSYSQQSRILDAIRFPLALMVVLIHCRINFDDWVLPDWKDFSGIEFSTALQIFFSSIVSEIAVPTFFLISGYFFFYKTDVFSFKVYANKLKKRIHTLLIPYLLWNILTILFRISVIVASYFINGKPLSRIGEVINANNWYRLFYDSNTWGGVENLFGMTTAMSSPILVPLWFMRDLMVMVVLTPVIYFAIRKLKVWFLLLLAIFYITKIWPYIPGLTITSLFFFSFGAYFSINKKLIVNEFRRYRNPVFLIYLILLVVMIYFNGSFSTIGTTIYPLLIMAGVVSAINLTSLLEEKGKLPVKLKLSETTFFIYAFHGLIGLLVAGMFLGIIFPIGDNYWPFVTAHFLLKPILTVIICIIAFCFMKRFTPGILNILTGNRTGNAK